MLLEIIRFSQVCFLAEYFDLNKISPNMKKSVTFKTFLGRLRSTLSIFMVFKRISFKNKRKISDYKTQ